ncbi:MAG: signal peptidase I [Anaerolineae bacterium]|nr:signal peptidase I [Anaerolineae bacterium]MDW8102418.1 signal peptidase I [Anaerolineae bacterium]
MRKLEAFARELVETVLLSLVLFFLIRTGVENYKVYGSSMEPNFYEGEYIMVNRLSYYFHPPQRGDVIVFRYPKDFRRTFIKRIIGLPGETVEIKWGKVYINGKPLNEPYPLAEATYSWGPTTVGPDEVFVLGDNRNFSSDSHNWGMLPIRYIVGKAWFCYWPPDRWRIIPSYKESLFLSPIPLPEVKE